MEEKKLKRVYPMFKFTNQSGTILKEVSDRDILYKILKNSGIDIFKSGAKITLDNEKYEIYRIDITIAENMWGNTGYLSDLEGEFDQFNTVINIIIK